MIHRISEPDVEAAINVSPPQGNPRFPFIDVVRGLAVLSIVALHWREGTFGTAAPWVRYWNLFGEGVPILFVISGFLLYRPLLSAECGHSPPIRIRDFYWRRVLRIVPGYWVALTILTVSLGLNTFGSDMWRYYGLAQAYNSRTFYGGLSITWSLSVEAGLYLVLPIFSMIIGYFARQFCRWRLQPRSALWSVCFFMTALFASTILIVLLFGNLPLPLRVIVLYSMIFQFGMLVAAADVGAHSSHAARQFLTLAEHRAGTFWIVGSALVFLSAASSLENSRPALVLPGLGAILLVIPATAGATRSLVVRSVLHSRTLAWVGAISYGLYLYHSKFIVGFTSHHEPLALKGDFYRFGPVRDAYNGRSQLLPDRAAYHETWTR